MARIAHLTSSSGSTSFSFSCIAGCADGGGDSSSNCDSSRNCDSSSNCKSSSNCESSGGGESLDNSKRPLEGGDEWITSARAAGGNWVRG